MALHSKRKLGFIDDLIPKPKDNPNEEEEWCQINTLVGSWLLKIELTLRTSVTYFEWADELWVDLK